MGYMSPCFRKKKVRGGCSPQLAKHLLHEGIGLGVNLQSPCRSWVQWHTRNPADGKAGREGPIAGRLQVSQPAECDKVPGRCGKHPNKKQITPERVL